MKNVYIDKLNNIVDKQSSTYQQSKHGTTKRTIKVRIIDANSSIYVDSDVENDNKDSKF